MPDATFSFDSDAALTEFLGRLTTNVLPNMPPQTIAVNVHDGEALTMSTPASRMGWDVHPPDGVGQAVRQVVGAASVCWDQVPHGQFQSERANEIAGELVEWLYDVWLPERFKDRDEKEKAAASTPVVSDQKTWTVDVKPVRVIAEINGRRVGSFTIATDGWVTVDSPVTVSRQVGRFRQLDEAIHAVMKATTWHDISQDRVQLRWVVEPTEDEDDLEA